MILKTFTNNQLKLRTSLMNKVRERYNTEDVGISSILSALSDFRDHVIVLFDDLNNVVGAVSYYISKTRQKISYIEVDHIGVFDRGMGYGTLLMIEVFKIAKLLDRDYVSLVSNGYSNDFYEKIGMNRVTSHLPAVYEMPKSKLKIY